MIPNERVATAFSNMKDAVDINYASSHNMIDDISTFGLLYTYSIPLEETHMRMIIAAAMLALPPVSFGSEWTKARVPYHSDATEAYKVVIPGEVTCHVGKLPRHGAVIVIVFRKQLPKGIRPVANTYELYHFEEAVIEAETGRLKEFNLGKVFRPPDQDGSPDLREGTLDPRLPCLAHAPSIPSPHVRTVMVRFGQQVKKTRNYADLFIDGRP